MNKLSRLSDLLEGLPNIISQNAKLMAITTSVFLIHFSIPFILPTSNAKLMDLSLKLFSLVSAQPHTTEYNELLNAIREDIHIFLRIETSNSVFYFFVAQITRIVIASSYYKGSNLSLKEFMIKVSRNWTRPFFTSFYIKLLPLSYTSFYFLPRLIPSLVLLGHPVILITILVFLAYFFIKLNLYLSVVWSLSVDVSVFKDTDELSAVGNAREVVSARG
ncbi:unnamed protein product [Lactuca saligna]|uniref:Uncharacterized protein n=1 Tax=Lactuca saligna TaxID=75948 RepID=A0AA36EFF0_LACSI|nr:unnamed protein product [Lactuca saligna]